ncbi:MAG TPA: hypothetical protein VNH18_35480 [Bryobacteraceae bacterium]|nr:hypothetical protein [Bryobacteraceae bacterium]
MPRYVFESKSGTRMTVVMSEPEAKERITKAGFLKVYRLGRYVPNKTFKLLSKVNLAPKLDFAGISRHECWPMRSDAMGVEVNQIRDAMKADEELGCKITYDENTGQAIFPDAATYKRYCEAHSFFDRNAGYGGPKRRDDREREIRGLPFLDKQEVPEYA